jgi:Holliday junction resolvasome RuvABC DNA-binding subunit
VTLAGKLSHLAGSSPSKPADKFGVDQSSVVTALQGLGWNERQASEAVSAVLDQLGDSATTDSVLRFALAKLGSGKSMTK